MIAVQKASIIFGGIERECIVLLDPKIFHLAFMSKSKFEEFFGRSWETGAATKVLLGIKHEANIDSYAVVDIRIKDKILKNVYVWLVDKDVNSILPPQYQESLRRPIDLVLGSTILENFGIKLSKTKIQISDNPIALYT